VSNNLKVFGILAVLGAWTLGGIVRIQKQPQVEPTAQASPVATLNLTDDFSLLDCGFYGAEAGKIARARDDGFPEHYYLNYVLINGNAVMGFNDPQGHVLLKELVHTVYDMKKAAPDDVERITRATCANDANNK
jgi:hypothetical protein